MKLSFSLGGGLGDYILDYLGHPGNRLPYLMMAAPDIEFRVSQQCSAGIELVKNTPYFKQTKVFEEKKFVSSKLPNDIRHISNIKDYPKLTPTLWIDDEEEGLLAQIPRPYGVFHPFASYGPRNLADNFDIHRLAQWAADTSGITIIVVGREHFGYESDNVKHIKGSPRLAVKIVERSSFFFGAHSSMQCAAWVHSIPSLCIAPNYLLFHNWYSPRNNDVYLKPLFKDKNRFMFYEQAGKFPYLFDNFLRTATVIQPRKNPEEYLRLLSLSGMVSEKY